MSITSPKSDLDSPRIFIIIKKRKHKVINSSDKYTVSQLLYLLKDKSKETLLTPS